VQTVDSDAMARSLAAGRRVQLHEVGLFSRCTAVRQVGEETFRLCKQYVDEIVLVDTDAICAAIKDVFADTGRSSSPRRAGDRRHEGLCGAREAEGSHAGAIACGANMNFDRLRFRCRTHRGRRGARGAFCGDDPGGARQFQALLRTGGQPQRHRVQLPHQRRAVAQVFVGISTSNAGDNEKLAKSFRQHGYATVDLTHDELAANTCATWSEAERARGG